MMAVQMISQIPFLVRIDEKGDLCFKRVTKYYKIIKRMIKKPCIPQDVVIV